MAIVTTIKEQTESIGSGKNKATFVEVFHGQTGIVMGDVDGINGIPVEYDWDTGSNLDDPFGLQLVSQEIMVDRTGGSAGTVHVGAYAFVSDTDTGEVGEGILNVENWMVDNILVLGKNESETHYDVNTNGVPVYAKEEYGHLPMQRTFITPKLKLEMTTFLSNVGAADSVAVSHKFVFKKVRITKSAYMEKLALRAYA